MWTTPIWWCGSLTSSSSSSAGVIVVVTAWQLLHSTPPSLFPRRHHNYHPLSQYSARYCKVTSTRVRGMTSFLSMSMNDSYEIEEENDDNSISSIQNVMTTTSTNIEETNDEDHDTTTTTSTTMIPANLRRKIQAKRPTLGHVVPYKYKQSQQQSYPPPPPLTTAAGATGGSIPSQLRLQGRRDTVDSITNTNSPNYLIKIMAGISRGRKLESPSTVYLRPMMGKVKEAMYSTLTSFGIYHTDDPSKHYQSIRHLDIFAGSGSVGLESLSRGATHCTFVDFSMDCCQCIQRNIDLTGLGTTTTSSSSSSSSSHLASPETKSKSKSTMVCCTDAMTALTDPYSVGVLQSSSSSSQQNAMTPYQIITICPPYEEVVYGDLLEAVVGSEAVTEDTIVIIEYPIELLQSPKQNKKNPISRSSAHSGMPHVIQAKSNTAIGIRNRKYGRTVIAFYIINPTGRYPDASSRPEEFVYPV